MPDGALEIEWLLVAIVGGRYALAAPGFGNIPERGEDALAIIRRLPPAWARQFV